MAHKRVRAQANRQRVNNRAAMHLEAICRVHSAPSRQVLAALWCAALAWGLSANAVHLNHQLMKRSITNLRLKRAFFFAQQARQVLWRIAPSMRFAPQA